MNTKVKIKSNTLKDNMIVYPSDSSQEMILMGHPLSWWLKTYELPLHLVYAPVVRQRAREFKDVFQKYYSKGKVRFAVKAHPHPSVLKIMAEEGIGADCASYNEARCALEAGIKPEKIDLNGSCKEDFLIKEAVEKGFLIIADSLEELEQVNKIAGSLDKTVELVLRLSGYNLKDVTAESVFTAGRWTKFGEPIDKISELLNNLHLYKNIKLIGFHTHIGSQITSPEPYIEVLGRMIELSRLLVSKGSKCKLINMGGGFPVSYVDKEEWDNLLRRIQEGYCAQSKGDSSKLFSWGGSLGGFRGNDGIIDFSQWRGEKFYSPYPEASMLEEVLKSDVSIDNKRVSLLQALEDLGSPYLYVEPGRSIMESAGITLTRAAHTRIVGEFHNLLTLEMGVTNQCGSLLHSDMKRWEIANDWNDWDPEPFYTFAGGNLCFSGDMLAVFKIRLQRKPKRGDVLLIHDTGAYTSSFFPSNANAFPRPSRLLVDEKGDVTLLKSRDSYSDIFSLNAT